VFQNPLNKEYIEVLDLYVYNQGLLGGNIPYATVVSMLKSVISVVLLFVANAMSKAVRGESII
jgi:putative aldouronate transport system permease protein